MGRKDKKYTYLTKQKICIPVESLTKIIQIINVNFFNDYQSLKCVSFLSLAAWKHYKNSFSYFLNTLRCNKSHWIEDSSKVNQQNW